MGLNIIQAVLALFLLSGGIIKLARVPFQVEHWNHYHYPLWFMSAVGILEAVGALALIGGIWNRALAIGSGALFVVLMAGAIHAHLFRAEQPIVTILPAAICLILSIIIIYSKL
ncbi:DoxX family protein [Brevibacillus borstelensis]|uniref:DoxX family protein n=1 Tax=Brevibacillus borstelensis TaxID=45462 RepID=UPI0030BF48CA